MKTFPNRSWFIIIIALVVINTAALAFMLFSRRPGPPGRPEVSAYLVRSLGLSPQQQLAYKKMVAEHRREADILTTRIRRDRDELFHHLGDPGMNDSTLGKLTAETGRLTGEL